MVTPESKYAETMDSAPVLWTASVLQESAPVKTSFTRQLAERLRNFQSNPSAVLVEDMSRSGKWAKQRLVIFSEIMGQADNEILVAIMQ